MTRISRMDFAVRERKGRKVGCLDPIGRAFERERENRRVVTLPLEFDTVLAHVFRCVCCGKTRPEEQRREPGSEVCIRCVRAAGFEC
jgi:hypothetical protein